MRGKCLILMLLYCVVLSYFCNAETPRWCITPNQILEGLQQPNPPQITMDTQNLASWTTSGIVTGISQSGETRLWRASVAKVTFVNPNSPDAAFGSISPSSPILIGSNYNCFDLWINGPAFSKVPQTTVKLRDKHGYNYNVVMTNNFQIWAAQSWWTKIHGALPSGINFPVYLVSIELSRITSANDMVYIDSLAFYNDTMDSWNYPEYDLPEPTTPDTILPTCYNDPCYSNSVQYNDGTYEFKYEGNDGILTYYYTPKTGTLNDIKAKQGDFEFYPLKDGGIIADVDGVVFDPTDSSIDCRLVYSKLSQAENTLETQWCWYKTGKRLTFRLNFEIKGKSLIVTVSSPKNNVNTFRIGRSENTPSPKLVMVPFFQNRWDTPRVLYSNGLFISAILDWWNTNASWLQMEKAQSGRCLDEVKILSGSSAIYNCGSIYFPKTNGERNTLYERLFLTVSPEYKEVLPNIPNPKSVYSSLTSNLIYSTRLYALQNKDDYIGEVAFWQKMKNYGMENILMRFHTGMFKPIFKCGDFTYNTNANRNFGDSDVQRLVVGLTALGFYPSVYTDYRPISPLNPLFSPDTVSRTGGNIWKPAYGGFLTKISRHLDLQAQIAPVMKSKYGWLGVYEDETTNTPPWVLVDYDHRTQGAGKVNFVIKTLAKVLQKEKDYYQGPVWSEGAVRYLWAGYTDTDYAQTWRPDDPPLVDFALLKLNQLENAHGCDLEKTFDDNLDWKLATQIVYGNMGHLWDSSTVLGKGLFHGLAKDITDYKTIVKSYYMMKQLQQRYAMILPIEIKYNDNGTLVDTSTAIANNAYQSSQVYIHYGNGLEVYANRSQSANWTVSVGDASYNLPANGYVAYKAGDILEYSALSYGRRVDYVQGPDYIYCDGRGYRTNFPRIQAQNCYAVKFNGNETDVIPTPFESEEDITVHDLGTITSVNGINEDGTVSSTPVQYTISDSNINLHVSTGIFKYRIICSNLGKLSLAGLTASDVLEKYRATQEKLQSFIAKSQSTIEKNSRKKEATSEFRYDSDRVNHRSTFWDGLITTKDDPGYKSFLWDGKQLIEYRQAKTAKNSKVFIKDNDLSKKRLIAEEYKGAALLGICGGDYDRIDTILGKADKISLRDKTEKVNESDCFVIDAATKHGKYTAWFDPQHGYNIAKIDVQRKQGDIVGNGTPLKADMTFMLTNVRFEKVSGVWCPMEADMQQTEGNGGKITKCHHKRTEMILAPDFETLKSFVPDDIPDGTKASFPGVYNKNYTWQNGAAIEEAGNDKL